MNTSGADGIKRVGGRHECPPVWSRGAWSALAFALAYTLASVPVALATGNNEFLFYIMVMAVLGAVVAWVGGYENTGWDLVANAVGAALAAVLIRLTWRDPSPPSTSG